MGTNDETRIRHKSSTASSYKKRLLTDQRTVQCHEKLRSTKLNNSTNCSWINNRSTETFTAVSPRTFTSTHSWLNSTTTVKQQAVCQSVWTQQHTREPTRGALDIDVVPCHTRRHAPSCWRWRTNSQPMTNSDPHDTGRSSPAGCTRPVGVHVTISCRRRDGPAESVRHELARDAVHPGRIHRADRNDTRRKDLAADLTETTQLWREPCTDNDLHYILKTKRQIFNNHMPLAQLQPLWRVLICPFQVSRPSPVRGTAARAPFCQSPSISYTERLSALQNEPQLRQLAKTCNLVQHQSWNQRSIHNVQRSSRQRKSVNRFRTKRMATDCIYSLLTACRTIFTTRDWVINYKTPTQHLMTY